MNVRRWIGYMFHMLMGLLFPYVLGGTVVLIRGLMAPSGTADKLLGFVIAAVYLGILAGVNAVVLRSEPRGRRGRTLAVNLAVWLATSATATFLLGRIG